MAMAGNTAGLIVAQKRIVLMKDATAILGMMDPGDDVSGKETLMKDALITLVIWTPLLLR